MEAETETVYGTGWNLPEVGDEIIVNGRYLGEITSIEGDHVRLRWTGPVWLGQRDTPFSINLKRATWEPA